MESRPVIRRVPPIRRTGGADPGARSGPPAHRSFRRAPLRVALALVVGLVGLVGVVGASAPAGALPDNGILTGSVVVRDAPAGFSGEVGVVACPATTPSVGLSASPQYAFSGSGGSYTLVLQAGSWEVHTFYSTGYEGATQGGSYLGAAKTVTITAGVTTRLNIAVRYQVPSGVSGTVSLTGIPNGLTIEQYQVTACPADTPFTGGIPSPLCASVYLNPGADTYSLPTLFKGTWLLTVGYYTALGFTNSPTSTTVTLKKGESTTVDLTAQYQPSPDALVEGTVTVTGAPPGFSATSGVGGCPAVSGPSAACPNPEYALSGLGGSYQLALAPGHWNLAGFYELAYYGGQFLSPVQSVDVAGGSVISLNFTVPYAPPATISSKVTVTGVPSGQVIEETLLLACPTLFPYTGGIVPIECVTTGEPAGVADSISTLPAGKWLLYPGYVASPFYSEVIGTTATPVKLTAGRSKVKNLSIAFGAP